EWSETLPANCYGGADSIYLIVKSAMATWIYRRKTHPVFITSDDLTGLQEFLAAKYQEFEWEAECIDGSHLVHDQLKPILDFENPRVRRIESLKVTFRRQNFKERGSVEFGDSGFRSCSCSIHGDDDAATLHIANELTRMFGEYRPWYFVARWLRPWVIFVGLSLFFGFLSALTDAKTGKWPAMP